MKSNLLKENIKKYCKPCYFSILKQQLKKYIKENQLDLDNNFKGNQLLPFLKQSEKLYNEDFKFEFIQSASIDNGIFIPIKVQIELIEETVKSITNDLQLQESLIDLKKRHETYMEELILNCKENKFNTIEELFSSPGLFNTRDLIDYEISLKDARKILSYDSKNYCFKPKNEYGLSVGDKINGVYFKIDTGNHLLAPSKENSFFDFIYQLYSNDNCISPTQLLFLVNILVLPFESSEIVQKLQKTKFQISHLKNSTDIISTQEAFEWDPDLKRTVLNSLIEATFSVQASHLIEGKMLTEFLLEAHQNPSMFESLDNESFQQLVISSFLLVPTDYKADNIMIEKDTNRFVGIDNDASIDSDELIAKIGDRWFVDAKNILYTLPLMNYEILPNIRESVLKVNPYNFIIDWLYNSSNNDFSLIDLVRKAANHFSENHDTVFENYKNQLKLPTFIPKGWSVKLYKKFCFIQNKLKENESITLIQLFQMVHPYLSEYYKCIETMVPSNFENIVPSFKSKYLYQYLILDDDKLEFKEIVKKHSNLDSISKDLLILKLSKETFTKSLREDCGVLFNNNKEANDNKVGFLDSIKEIVKQTEYSQSLFIEDNEVLHFIKKVYSSLNFNSEKLFHRSWCLKKYEIFLRLIRAGADNIYLKYFIDIFNVDLKEPIKSLKECVYHVSINSKNENYISQIELFKSMGVDIDIKNNDLSPLEISIKNNDFQLFNKLLSFGAGSNYKNDVEFIRFYNSLNDEQKLTTKDKIDFLFHCNQKLAWELSLSQLLPPANKDYQREKGELIIKRGNDRYSILRNVHFNQIYKFNIEQNQYEPIKSENQDGARHVPFISDEFGHKIFFKFYPQIPGVETAVNRLTGSLFGNCTPFNEICNITDENLNLYNVPVLLVQNVPGATLGELFKITSTDNKVVPPELYKIEPYSMSQALVSAIIINSGDGNLGNYIVSPCNGSDKYRIIAIDNDQSFMPAVAKKLKVNLIKSKPSLQVQTVLFLLDNMYDFISDRLVNEIIRLDMDVFMKTWLGGLLNHHSAAIELFKGGVNSKCQTIIGIPFAPGMVERLYLKLVGLKLVLEDTIKNDKKITHLELLQFLEPEISKRYMPYLSNKSSPIVDKFSKIKLLKESATISELSTSLNQTIDITESRDFPNVNDIIEVLNSGKYCPEQAILEFENIKEQYNEFEKIKNNCKKSKRRVWDGVLQKLLPGTDFSKMSMEQEQNFFSSIGKGLEREICFIEIKGSKIFSFNIFKELFNPTFVTKINISKCEIFESLNYIEFPNLIHLLVNDCPKFVSIKIKCENLKILNISNCPSLISFLANAPNLESLILVDSISNSNLVILELINRYKNLIHLDISFSKTNQFNFKASNLYLELVFPKLVKFKAINFIGVTKFLLYLPKVEIFEIDLSYAELIIGEMTSLNLAPTPTISNEMLDKLSKIQVNMFGLTIETEITSLKHNLPNTKTHNFSYILPGDLIENKMVVVDTKSKLFIRSCYVASFNIIFLHLNDLNNSINILTEQLSMFNLKSKLVKPIDFAHSKFILVKVMLAGDIDDSSLRKIEEFEKKFRIDDNSLIKRGPNDCFVLELNKILKNYQTFK